MGCCVSESAVDMSRTALLTKVVDANTGQRDVAAIIVGYSRSPTDACDKDCAADTDCVCHLKCFDCGARLSCHQPPPLRHVCQVANCRHSRRPSCARHLAKLERQCAEEARRTAKVRARQAQREADREYADAVRANDRRERCYDRGDPYRPEDPDSDDD